MSYFLRVLGVSLGRALVAMPIGTVIGFLYGGRKAAAFAAALTTGATVMTLAFFLVRRLFRLARIEARGAAATPQR